MKALIFGRTGQVARELARSVPRSIDATFLGREDADLSDPETCADPIGSGHFDVVINAAAYTAVDKAEDEEELATLINGHAPGSIALACSEANIPFIHISTDYVFDGLGDTPFGPVNLTAPVNAYGRAKRLGETKVEQSGARFVILRTSWVFSAHGHNFVKTMLRLGKERSSLNVVADQIGGPTSADAIATTVWSVSEALASGHRGGTYHFSGSPDVSWAEFARTIMNEAGLDCEIYDIPTSNYPTPARRPTNSRLDCSSLESDFRIQRPDWHISLRNILAEIGELS